MGCSEEQFISNLIEINRRAKVDPEIIDLISAYTRLCLRYNKEINFYDEYPTLKTKKITIKRFIEKNPELDKRSLSFLVSYAELMRERGLPFIFNLSHLASFLSTSLDRLKDIIRNKESYYHTFYIPKNNGEKRPISAPNDELKIIQRKILREILERVSIHSSAHGFKRERSIITNAQNHTGHEVVIKIDIKDFFPSIRYERVKGVYMNLGYPEKVADALAELSTHRGRLPRALTSQILYLQD